jgi:hypothetical protein
VCSGKCQSLDKHISYENCVSEWGSDCHLTSISEVYGGKCTFMCLRKAISCKRAQKPFFEDLKQCGLEECGEADLR